MQPAVRTSAAAIWSLVLGILSIVLCIYGCIFTIPAVICGHVARGNIKKSGGALTGDGMALAGLIMGYLGMVMTVLLLLIATPSFMKIRAQSQKSTCMNGQRLVMHATEEWAMQNNVSEGTAISSSDRENILAFLKDSQLPKCPANNLPIQIPARYGDNVVCPDPELTRQHTLP